MIIAFFDDLDVEQRVHVQVQGQAGMVVGNKTNCRAGIFMRAQALAPPAFYRLCPPPNTANGKTIKSLSGVDRWLDEFLVRS